MNNHDTDWDSIMYSVFQEDSTDSSFGLIGMSVLNLNAYKMKDKAEDEEKICAVCGDKANGYHFHVLTCEGCKGFFRRAISNGSRYSCTFTGSCLITKTKRQCCKACRLQKCLNVGMRKDMILSEEALLARREVRMRKKQERLLRTLKVAEVGSLTDEQKQLISILLEARNNFDSKLEHFVGYRLQPLMVPVTCGNTTITSHTTFSQYSSLYPITEECMEGDGPPENVKEIPHFADLNTYIIKQVIKFAKEIPAFRNLPVDDQISLLKGATLEVAEFQYNHLFNLDTNQWECGKITFRIEDGALAGLQEVYLDHLLKFHTTLRKLNLHDAEYGLMQALALFSPDRPGIIEHSHIDKIHETVALTLKCYIDYHHPLPESRFLYAKLLSLMAELRTLEEESTKQIMRIQTFMSDAMTPLMKEIFS